MPRSLVTGCAGFIGSHLAERLIAVGHEVIGVDALTDFYSRDVKLRNLTNVLDSERFSFVEADLLHMDLPRVLRSVDYVFHQAGQPGVRPSWRQNFELYLNNNVLATQRLLEAAINTGIKRFVYASSSSIYGDAETMPTPEDALPKPVSPYGASKLAGEHLCYLYWKNFWVPTVALRYFTVYGPRQRPDMAFHRFIRAISEGRTLQVYGDGEQSRDFTYVSDAVEANLLAAEAPVVGQVFNIGGGSRVTVNRVIDLLGRILGAEPRVEHLAPEKGDVRHTSADVSKAKAMIGYFPAVGIEEGLRREAEWLVG
ncbi:MAG: NAD-dependent epimerase/dehydratase family protein [Armatimonadota bacterium]